MIKNEIGITLVALVITIVVLILLVGVSINLVLGENGAINKAKLAEENTLLAQNEEYTEIAKTSNYIDEIVTSDRSTSSSREFGYFIMSQDQVGSGSHIVAYDTNKESRGLTLDTTNNSVKLTAGKSYKISYGIRGITAINNDAIYAVYDITNNKWVSQKTASLPPTYSNAYWTSISSTECIYTPINECNICIKNDNSINSSFYFSKISSSYSYWVIEEL